MATVEITIRTASNTSIMVSGEVADTAIEPITAQLSALLYSSATGASASAPV